MFLRLPQFAGTFYPQDPLTLKRMIEDFFHQVVIEKLQKQPRALIVPHAGYLYSGLVAAFGFKMLEGYQYEKVILLGPSHYFYFDGLASSPNGYWQTPLGKIACLGKEDFVSFQNAKEVIESALIHESEHCLEVEVPFLQLVLRDFTLIPLLTGEGDMTPLANLLNTILDDNVLLIISSDLSHYYPYEVAKQKDKITLEAILNNNIEAFQKKGEACGKKGIEILMTIAKKRRWQPKLLKALNSGDITQEKDQVVGYGSILYY